MPLFPAHPAAQLNLLLLVEVAWRNDIFGTEVLGWLAQYISSVMAFEFFLAAVNVGTTEVSVKAAVARGSQQGRNADSSTEVRVCLLTAVMPNETLRWGNSSAEKRRGGCGTWLAAIVCL